MRRFDDSTVERAAQSQGPIFVVVAAEVSFLAKGSHQA